MKKEKEKGQKFGSKLKKLNRSSESDGQRKFLTFSPSHESRICRDSSQKSLNGVHFYELYQRHDHVTEVYFALSCDHVVLLESYILRLHVDL